MPRCLDQQDLVAADAEMAVGDVAQLFRRKRNLLSDAIGDNEVVTQTVHFDEFQFHNAPHIRIRKE